VYAVIQTGGKQYRVAEGDQVAVELLGAGEGGEAGDVTFAPLLVVDGGETVSGHALGAARVTARVLGTTKGPKVIGFSYRPKSRGRRRWGHRQHYSLIEITGITRT
jgi:large subunit ribosomal protein L21